VQIKNIFYLKNKQTHHKNIFLAAFLLRNCTQLFFIYSLGQQLGCTSSFVFQLQFSHFSRIKKFSDAINTQKKNNKGDSARIKERE